jgi:hypothetical protein
VRRRPAPTSEEQWIGGKCNAVIRTIVRSSASAVNYELHEVIADPSNVPPFEEWISQETFCVRQERIMILGARR